MQVVAAARRLAERLGHDAPGAEAVGGGERALARLAAAAVADQERVELGAHGSSSISARLRPPAIRPLPAPLAVGGRDLSGDDGEAERGAAEVGELAEGVRPTNLAVANISDDCYSSAI
jgi:hypothetical protein